MTDRPVSDADYLAVERFLNREAALLDRRDFEAWLALLADDIYYRVTMQVVREAGQGNREYAIIEDRRDGLASRIAQTGNPRLTRAENPPSITRRMVSNLEATYTDGEGEIAARTSILVYRSRTTLPEGGFYVGERRDLLRHMGGALKLARREVRLDHDLVFGGPVSILF